MSEPFKTLGRAVKQLFTEMVEDGVDPQTPMGAKVIGIWLDAPTTLRCDCGNPMKRWESINKRCNPCRLRSLRNVKVAEEAEHGR